MTVLGAIVCIALCSGEPESCALPANLAVIKPAGLRPGPLRDVRPVVRTVMIGHPLKPHGIKSGRRVPEPAPCLSLLRLPLLAQPARHAMLGWDFLNEA